MKKIKKNIIFYLVFIVLISTFAVLAAESFNSPSSCSGQWTNCNNAFADNANRATATATSTSDKSGIWYNYGFSIPASAVIDNVVIRSDFFASNIRGYIDVKVSGDGGNTFGPSHVVGGNTAEQTFLVDVTNDLSWTSSKLDNANFRINVRCFKNGSGSNPKCNLDWIPVNVTYTLDKQPVAIIDANPENGTAPLTVSFTGSVAGGDSPFTYFWDFTDGVTSTEQNPIHTFNLTGAYNVTFKVTDFDGDMSTASKMITVT